MQEEAQPPRTLSFDPENIIHPWSTEWIPCVEVAHYVQDRIRKGFDRDVHDTFRSECPRPLLLGKMVEMPELDPNMATFIKRFSKEPKKGLDRAWKRCQDKLLDISGPLTKILELAVQAKESNTPIDPHTILEWAQRAISLLGNANYAMPTECRCSCLMRVAPYLAELAANKAGSLANGLLFGDKFVKELGKYVATFSPLDKAQSSMKKMSSRDLFARTRL
ncbi:hypothetical protein NDU88_000672 [Pleurodeles waltl]|uniref:Uncharacterized protein n=1 Tax=Pleurodeles waltl TaxID=8319 RepID=A0AAV7L8T7_PLEWA|nr:hypothetical protein NDU88_000672 [Pleurodeles waltl]